MASCDRRIHCSSIFVVVSLLLLFFSQAIEANVFVPSHDKVFESNPALLGKAWSSSTLAEGRLQFLVENPKLCSLSGNESPVLFFENDEQDNLPLLTLLIERGDCKFSQKVAAATSWSNGADKYIIVYDNEDGELMDMTGKTSEDVGLLFVSLSTGKQLREILLEQNTNQTTGLWIQMDGKRPISQHSHIKNKMKTTFNRLLLALSVSDIVVSAAWFFSTWALPKKAPPGIDQEYYEYEFPYTAGSIGTCSAQVRTLL